MPKWFIGLNILLGSLLGVLFMGSYASAASVYDDVVTIPSDIEMIDDNTSITKDFTANIVEQSIEALNAVCLGTGHWSHDPNACTIISDTVYSTLVYDRVNKKVVGYYAISPLAYAEFYVIEPGQPWETNALRLVMDTSIAYKVEFAYVENPGSINVSSENLWANSITSSTTHQIATEGGNTDMILSQLPITYPLDYEGEEIPESYSVGEGLKADLQPQHVLSVDEKGNLNLKYSDNLDYEFEKGATVSISESDSGCSSSTLVGLYTFDNYKDVNLNSELPSQGWYTVNVVTTEDRILPWSGCINWVGKPITIGTIGCEVVNGFYQCKEFNADDIYNECLNTEAPFLHFVECKRAFSQIINSMSFGTIKPLEQFRYESTTECRELEVLGDWMNLENKTLCPQFSSEVRGVVTPFMSFGLSLTVLGAILTKSRNDFM